jgi:hypothetical protein
MKKHHIYKKILLILFILTCIFPLTAGATPTISIQAPQQTTPQQEFTVNILINAPEDEIYAAQFDLTYNPDLLEAIKITQGDFLATDATTIIGAKNIQHEKGVIQYGESRAAVKTGISGEGRLATITFKTKTNTQASAKLTLNNVILVSPQLKEIPATTRNTTLQITTEESTKTNNAPVAPPSEKGDVNTDGNINFLDATLLALSWGTDNPSADLNQDGIVDMQDMNLLINILNRQ